MTVRVKWSGPGFYASEVVDGETIYRKFERGVDFEKFPPADAEYFVTKEEITEQWYDDAIVEDVT